MNAITLVAHVFDAVTGLAKRTVISDDYASAAGLIAAQCTKGEDALVTEYAGSLDENRISMAIKGMSDEERQAAITDYCKIEPPPLIKYALCGPTGKVFEVIETRRPEDVRLRLHRGFEQAKEVPQNVLSSALAVVAEYPDLALMQKEAITPEIQSAHDKVAAARYYGVLDDLAPRLDAAVQAITKERDTVATVSGFQVYKGDALQWGDAIEADGTVRKLIVEPVIVGDVVGDVEVVL